MSSTLEKHHSSLDLGEVTLHWSEAGSGRPIVLLHGLNDSHRTWRDVWPLLPGRRVLMLDLPGHGLSSRPDAPYTLDWNATQVARWMEHLDLRDADVVGHSYGGGVAQWLLLKCRLRIRRLGLLASGGLGRQVYPWLRLASVPLLVERFGQPAMGRIAGFFLARATTVDAKAEIALLAGYLRRPGSARAFSRAVRDVIGWRGQRRNIFDRLDDIAELPPMRLFWGTRDTIVPMSQAAEIVRLLESCELVRFEDHGHFVHWEDPVRFARELTDFLDASDVSPARLRHPRRARPRLQGAAV